MLPWHNCGPVDALEPDRITEVSYDGKTFCLLRKSASVHAFAATCPHSGARFCDGWLDANERIVCPLHKYRFNPANGHNTSGEGYKLKTFPAELREGFIFVQF